MRRREETEWLQNSAAAKAGVAGGGPGINSRSMPPLGVAKEHATLPSIFASTYPPFRDGLSLPYACVQGNNNTDPPHQSWSISRASRLLWNLRQHMRSLTLTCPVRCTRHHHICRPYTPVAIVGSFVVRRSDTAEVTPVAHCAAQGPRRRCRNFHLGI